MSTCDGMDGSSPPLLRPTELPPLLTAWECMYHVATHTRWQLTTVSL